MLDCRPFSGAVRARAWYMVFPAPLFTPFVLHSLGAQMLPRARARASFSLLSLPGVVITPYSTLVRARQYSVYRAPFSQAFAFAPGFLKCALHPNFVWQVASGSSAFQSPSSSSSGGSNPDCPWEMAASGVLVHHLMSELVDTYTFCSAGRPAARPPVVRVRQANKAAVEVARVTDRRLRLPPRHLLHSLPFHPTYSTPLTELFTQLCSGGSGGGVSFLPSSSSCSSFSPLLALSRSYSNQLQLCQSQAVGSASF